jgi:N-acetylneuraminate synthase
MTHSVYIIAEAGVNHNGSLATAFELVDAACQAGANAIKFQTFSAERLVTKTTSMAPYQQKNIGVTTSQFDMLKSLELQLEDFAKLDAYCKRQGIDFMSTAFDQKSLDELLTISSPPYLKISSGDLIDAPLILHAAQKNIPLILSSGMATSAEIENALSIIAFAQKKTAVPPSIKEFKRAWQEKETRQSVQDNVILMQCTTSYPAPLSSVNLRTMSAFARDFGVKVGFSDHTNGIDAALAACALGACAIEKHITLSKTMSGPDHIASTEPDEFAEMVERIRNIELALGSDKKEPMGIEYENRTVARKSLIAAQIIKKGEIISQENIQILRPGNGTPAIYYWDIVGSVSQHDYTPGQPLQEVLL